METTVGQFADKVLAMRTAQKAYSKTASRSARKCGSPSCSGKGGAE